MKRLSMRRVLWPHLTSAVFVNSIVRRLPNTRMRTVLMGSWTVCGITLRWTITSSGNGSGPSESGSEKFEKWKVKKWSFHSFSRSAKWKKICFHSFSRSAKWKINAFTLFREVKSEIKMLRDRDREVKILENSWQFSRNEILQQNYSMKAKKDCSNRWLAPAFWYFNHWGKWRFL